MYAKELPYIRSSLDRGSTIGKMARELKIHPNTLSRYLKEAEEG